MYVYRGETAKERYIGGIKNGYRHGYGYYEYQNMTTMNTIIYKGWWKDHKRSGYGEERNSEGTYRYVGQFLENKKHGHGCHLKGGDLYIGQYKEGLAHGRGCLMNALQ